MHSPFKITYPHSGDKLPILVSVPHCGSLFPDHLRKDYEPALLSDLDDTDWYVDKLYGFSPSVGITMISAVYHRWVIDLNRPQDSTPLYSDGRIVTGLAPKTDFKGRNLYKSHSPDKSEIESRINDYYKPYHDKITEILDELKSEFGKLLLFDAHSIRQHVPAIHPHKFPDLILGDNDGASANEEIIRLAKRKLEGTQYHFKRNFLFKGGFITRHYGNPNDGIHALQLEMTKINYMNKNETIYDPEKAGNIQLILKDLLLTLGHSLLNQQ